MLVALEQVRQLGDAGGFADTVHADDEIDADRRRLGHDQRLRLTEQQRQLFFERRAQLGAAFQVLHLHALAQRSQQPLRRRHANIAANQRVFQFVPDLVGDFVRFEDVVYASEELASAPEAEAEEVARRRAPLVRRLVYRLRLDGEVNLRKRRWRLM